MKPWQTPLKESINKAPNNNNKGEGKEGRKRERERTQVQAERMEPKVHHNTTRASLKH